jgi:Arylsulfotransferase (ASST)
MNHSFPRKTSLIVVIFFITGAWNIACSSSEMLHRTSPLLPTNIDGQILFSPIDSTTTYLIKADGTVNHTWSSSFLPGVGVRWVGDGTILRTIRVDVGPGGGGAGGGVQKVKWDGTLVWDFRYNTEGKLTHHDVKILPNGNVLLIAWETKTRQEAITAGRNPDNVWSSGLMPDHIVEVKPTGPTSGEIVWEWHVWDHLIQDYDPAKENYGVVADHPELVDINYGIDLMSMVDWLHTNSVDYHEEFDQILLSVHNFNEIWVIDHSTTTQESAGHTGGNSGKGGDLLYRWGNPAAYDAGLVSDQKFFGQHDATWITSGCPGEGNILVFNNGANRPGGWYSSVDEIIPPVNESGEYYLEPGSAYGPDMQTWVYTADPPTSFVAGILSGAERLKSGNTLICDGVAGRFFEVTPQGTTLWEYVNPYPSPGLNNVFKIVYIPPEAPPQPNSPDLDCIGSLSWTKVTPGTTVTGTFQVQNIGDSGSLLNWTINTSSIPWGTWMFIPQEGENLTPEQGPVTIQVTVIAPDEPKTDFEGYIRIENQQDLTDFCVIPVTLKTPLERPHYLGMFFQYLINRILDHLPFLTQWLPKNMGF